jgi:hypothetical protein
MIADTKLMITVHTHTGRPVHVLNCTTQYLVPGTWYLVPVMSKGTRYQVQQLVPGTDGHADERAYANIHDQVLALYTVLVNY